jgi:hypothetical protein
MELELFFFMLILGGWSYSELTYWLKLVCVSKLYLCDSISCRTLTVDTVCESVASHYHCGGGYLMIRVLSYCTSHPWLLNFIEHVSRT